jgi:hypothetical protein
VDAAGGLARLAFAVERQLPGFAVVWLLAGFALVAPPVAGRPARGLLGGWLVACLAGASIGLYFRPHYFIQALPPLAALCGIGLAGVARSFSGWVGPGIAVTGAAALALAPPLLANRATLFAGSPAAASRVIYGLNPFPESPRIADHLRATSEPDDRVLIVGSEPQILFYARRRSATRYIFFYPLLRDLPRALERQRQALLEIEAARPLLVVWVSLPTSLGVEGARGHPLLDSVRAMLRRDYRVELIARPVPGAAEYEFVEGPAAQRLDREARAAGDEPIWIAVYRRNS